MDSTGATEEEKTAYQGITIFHCHILAHEDQGAMAWMNVLDGRPPPLFPGDGEYSEWEPIDVTPTDPPSAPVGLSATAVSTSQIDLAWTDTSDNETGFLIDRSLNGVDFAVDYAVVGAGATAYSDTGLTSDTTYYYRIAADNSAGSSAYSNTDSATTQAGGAATRLDVGSIIVSTVNGARGAKFGQATISVVDDIGNPVGDALVTGDFSGDINEGAVEDQADADGISILQTSQSVKRFRNLQFCVTSILPPAGSTLLPYDDPSGARCGSL